MSKSKKKSAKMNMIHFWALTGRYMRQKFGNLPSLLLLILQIPVLLLIVFITYHKDSFAIKYIPYGNTTLFIIVFIGSLAGLLNSYREITKEKEILTREIAGGLDPTSYVFSKLFVQGIIALAQSLLLVLGSLIFIDYGFEKPVIDVLLYVIILFLVIWGAAAIGLLISAIVKKSENAILPVLIIIIGQVVFSGVMFELDAPVSYIGCLTPCMWGLAAIGGGLLDMNAKFRLFAQLTKRNASYAVYDYNILLAVCMLAAIIVLCYLATVSVITGKHRKKKN